MNASDPITTLRHAHDIGLEKLDILSGAMSRLTEGSYPTALADLREVLRFFDTELKVHFRHEEEALFPALATVIGREGPIKSMLDEHQSLWRAVDTLREKMGYLESAPEDDAPKIAQEVKLVADHIVGLLGGHIGKEDSMLFPIAEESLSVHTMQQLAEQMKAIGQAA